MPKIRFSENFDFSPAAKKGALTLAYKAGGTYTVTTECSKKAIAAGKGVAVVRKKSETSVDKKNSDADKT